MNRGNLVFLAIVLIILSIAGYLIYQGIKEGEKIELYWKSDDIKVLEFKKTEGGTYISLHINGCCGSLVLKLIAQSMIKFKVKVFSGINVCRFGFEAYNSLKMEKNGWSGGITWCRFCVELDDNRWYDIIVKVNNVTTNAKLIEYEYKFSAATKYIFLEFAAYETSGYKVVKEAKEIWAEVYISKT